MQKETIVDRIEETYTKLTKADVLLEHLLESYIVGAWREEKFRTQQSVEEEEVLFTILSEIVHDALVYAEETVNLAISQGGQGEGTQE